jgi:tungstate transport system ATP-binding protein
MSGNVLELRGVTVSYDGRTVLDIPHLELCRGETLTLLGENGSGKTTLLRLLGLLIRPDRGMVLFGGEEVDFGSPRALLELRRRMAAVMQQPLLCKMSVRRNISLGLRFRRLPKAEIAERVEAWLSRLSISHLGDRPASKLSGGEAQRTSLARAMAIDPEVLFLDEPFAALDAPTRQGLLQEFQAVLADTDVTTLFATHDRGEALGLGDRVAVLMGGRIAQIGPAEEVFTRPAEVEIARFVGVETLIPGQVIGDQQVDCGAFRLATEDECEAGEEILVAVRPEEIELYAGSSAPAADLNLLQGMVVETAPAETHYRVEIDCGVKLVAVVGRSIFREMKLAPGRHVKAGFAAGAAHLIRKGTKPT